MEVFSAGIEPANCVHPLVVKVMAESGIDISQYKTKGVNQFLDQPFDYVITVSPEANKNCPSFNDVIKNRWHLAFNNPAEIIDNQEETINEFRLIRKEIEEGFLSFYRSQIAGQSGCSCCCGQ
jgi:arsenate reductase